MNQPNSTNNLVRCEQVSKVFSLGTNEVRALTDVSVSIDRGGVVAVMGPSGSGKSTLLNLIGALDSPSSGLITINGESLADYSADARAVFRNKMVGFVFQNFNLIPVLTAYENVILPSQLSRNPLNFDINERASELLTKVGLSQQMHQSVNRLSGGQMQRVALARALMNKPELILADEPTANLDQTSAHMVLKLMRDLSVEENTTVIISTHDHSVLKYCQRVISLRDGHLVNDELNTNAPTQYEDNKDSLERTA